MLNSELILVHLHLVRLFLLIAVKTSENNGWCFVTSVHLLDFKEECLMLFKRLFRTIILTLTLIQVLGAVLEQTISLLNILLNCRILALFGVLNMIECPLTVHAACYCGTSQSVPTAKLKVAFRFRMVRFFGAHDFRSDFCKLFGPLFEDTLVLL